MPTEVVSSHFIFRTTCVTYSVNMRFKVTSSLKSQSSLYKLPKAIRIDLLHMKSCAAILENLTKINNSHVGRPIQSKDLFRGFFKSM